MEKSNLIPFLRRGLDILFIGLNPALGSSRNKQYFSVVQSFWDQLYRSGLITQYVDKSIADELIFGLTDYNFNNWNFGITDLVTSVAESNSRKVEPTHNDTQNLKRTIEDYSPRVVIILHGKVLKKFLEYIGIPVPESNSGYMGNILAGHPTVFYNIAFPHGNTITSSEKIERYREVKEYLLR
jgi:G:T/U-mismatch repair DNA glycosylase